MSIESNMVEATTKAPILPNECCAMPICLVSGGKDSQATAIWCLKNNIKPLFLFCDTEWEDVVTYDFINEFEKKLGQKIIRLTSMGFEKLALKKKRFPSTKGKFCTEELKVKPMIDFILEQKANITIYQGIRWEESTNRAGMQKSDEYFRYYFEPYKITGRFDDILKTIELGFIPTSKKNDSLLKRLEKKNQIKVDDVNFYKLVKEANELPENRIEHFYTYRKNDIIEWLKTYSCDVERPIISWNVEQVFAYIIDNGFMPNILYQYGFTRVGCFPCIMCTKDEIAKIVEYRPEKIEYIKNLEIKMNSTFFPPNYIPTNNCSKIMDVKDKKTGKMRKVGIPSIMDVVKYVQSKGYGSGLFTGSHCQNQFLPCE